MLHLKHNDKIYDKLNKILVNKIDKDANKIAATILAVNVEDKDNIDEELDRYKKNISHFFQNEKNVEFIKELDVENCAMVISFIAIGSKSIEKQKINTIEILNNEIEEIIKGDYPEISDEQIKEILHSLESEIEELMQAAGKNKTGMLDKLKSLAVILKFKKQIALNISFELTKLIRKNINKKQKKTISKYSKIGAFLAGGVGLAIATFSGFGIIELLLPLGFATGAFKGIKNYVSQKLGAQNLQTTRQEKFKAQILNNLKIKEYIDKETKQDKLNTIEQKSIEKIMEKNLEIKQSLKGVFSRECNVELVTKSGEKTKENTR
jgi:hypothetical protein